MSEKYLYAATSPSDEELRHVFARIFEEAQAAGELAELLPDNAENERMRGAISYIKTMIRILGIRIERAEEFEKQDARCGNADGVGGECDNKTSALIDQISRCAVCQDTTCEQFKGCPHKHRCLIENKAIPAFLVAELVKMIKI